MKIIADKDGQLQFDFPEPCKPLTNDDIRWAKMKCWLKERMLDTRLAGDAYRYTAYEATYKKMEELERD